MELKGKKIVFLGDSITEGYGTSGIEHHFVTLIGQMGECEVKNYGIGGTRFARQIMADTEANDGAYCIRVEELDDDADVVIVFGGTNDFGHGNAPLGTFEDRSLFTFYGGCHHLMTRLHERFPGKQIVILTPLHRCNEDNPKGDGNKDCNVGTLKTYVEIIREMAEYYSLPVLDLYAVSGIQPKVDAIREKLCPDGLHPNDAGHRILAEKIFNFLKSL
jgi:lysophospholipase L1-like esterase